MPCNSNSNNSHNHNNSGDSSNNTTSQIRTVEKVDRVALRAGAGAGRHVPNFRHCTLCERNLRWVLGSHPCFILLNLKRHGESRSDYFRKGIMEGLHIEDRATAHLIPSHANYDSQPTLHVSLATTMYTQTLGSPCPSDQATLDSPA